MVASSSSDAKINIWETTWWTSIRIYKGHSFAIPVFDLDLINNDTIASSSWDGTIHIWKISTGQTLGKIDIGNPLYSMKVLSNGFQLAYSLFSSSDTLRIYNYTTSTSLSLAGHSNTVNSIEVLSNRFMASGSMDDTVIIWDLTTYKVKYILKQHKNDVNCVKRLSSSLIASADTDGTIIIWNWLKGELVYILKGHTGPLFQTSLDLYEVDDDEKNITLISGSFDKTIKLWNIASGTLIQTLNVNIQINALAMLEKS